MKKDQVTQTLEALDEEDYEAALKFMKQMKKQDRIQYTFNCFKESHFRVYKFMLNKLESQLIEFKVRKDRAKARADLNRYATGLLADNPRSDHGKRAFSMCINCLCNDLLNDKPASSTQAILDCIFSREFYKKDQARKIIIDGLSIVHPNHKGLKVFYG